MVRYADQQGVIRAEPRPSRDMGMAIKEYHPYAVILSGREKVFTRAVAFDSYKTEELKARLSGTPLEVQPLVCPACGELYDGDHGTHCTCGTGLTRMELLFVPQHRMKRQSFIVDGQRMAGVLNFWTGLAIGNR